MIPDNSGPTWVSWRQRPASENRPEVDVVSGVTEPMNDGYRSRWNGRRAAPSLLPRWLATHNIYPPRVILSIRLGVRPGWPMQVLRYIVVLLAGFLAGSRVVDAAQTWREWRVAATASPNAAELHGYFLRDLGIAVLSLAIAALIWWLLRPASSTRK